MPPPTAITSPAAPAPARPSWPIATALRRVFKAGYGASDLRADAMSGVVVGIVALPLSMALAIATGVAPQHGLYTAIVAGMVVALLGGSKHQVTGPTAAFIVVLAPIVAQHGLSGLLTAGLMAGLMLVAMGAARLGKLIQFIPYPVTTGFTAGIAVVIATLQIKDVFGLDVPRMPDSFLQKLGVLVAARGSASLADFAVAAITLALLLGLPRLTRRVPAPLIAISVSSALAVLLVRVFPTCHVATIGSRFHAVVAGREVAGIPPILPPLGLPWRDAGLSFETIRTLFPAAFAIAMLGAIESLLSAVIADGMTGKRHDPDAELVALGIGNILAPFFGGIAATGALARTATNVRAGARSPFSAVIHAVVVLLAILVLAPLVAYVPMAALAALLLLVAWNMSDVRHVAHLVRIAPRSDVIVLATCFLLTVFVDMVAAVSVGVVLAALLFMRRMADATQSRMLAQNDTDTARVVPERVALYEIAGPLFFGAANRATAALEAIDADVRVVVLSLGSVPMIDATGFAALETAVDRLQRRKTFVIIAGPLPEPRSIFERARLEDHHDGLTFAPTLAQALVTAKDLVLLNPDWGARLASGVKGR